MKKKNNLIKIAHSITNLKGHLKIDKLKIFKIQSQKCWAQTCYSKIKKRFQILKNKKKVEKRRNLNKKISIMRILSWKMIPKIKVIFKLKRFKIMTQMNQWNTNLNLNNLSMTMMIKLKKIPINLDLNIRISMENKLNKSQ